MTACAFCSLDPAHIVASNDLAVAIRDRYPVSHGHSLIIPRRHVVSFFEATPAEQAALLSLVSQAKAGLAAELKPDGYNIGINDGPAAGQTVPHLHVHLIPRFKGDRPDPRGGVRWMFPEKADYWSRP